MLEDLGISPAGERLYRELLRHPGLPASEVGEPAEVEALVQAGFVVRTGEVLRAVPPAVAIRALLHERRAELHARAAVLERAHAEADDVATRILASVPGPVTEHHGIETVVGRPEIARRVGEVVAAAAEEILVLDRPPYARPGGSGRSAMGERELLDRGIATRVVFASDGLDLPGRMASIAELVDAGLQARVATHVPTKLVIVDRRVAVLPPSDLSDPTETALVVREALLLNALVPLFDATWERASPLGSPGAADELDADDRLLLTLLAGGLKDEAVGRQLGVHVHTARRRISRLLDRLGATSRFQAGAEATRRGWLDRPS